jgi:hypothetical protein
MYTRDLHGIKTRRIIKCGATIFDLVHGALLWLMMAPDNPAGYLSPSSASLRYIGNGGQKGTAVRTAQARRYPSVLYDRFREGTSIID